ncbi:MAG: hypothetical protein M0P74_02195 [Syntrophales bacterium]|nr:hypothetical protein [Syntrophales bacterium]
MGLKYCGGCRAQYDRVALVDDLRERLAEKAEFIAADSEDAEEILIVCGCSTSCAKVESALPKLYLTSPKDADSAVEQIKITRDGR